MNMSERAKLLDVAEIPRRESHPDVARQVQNVAMRDDPEDNG